MQQRPHEEVAIQTQVSLRFWKNPGIPKHPEGVHQNIPKLPKALGKQKNIMEVNAICHLISRGTFQGLICCHLLATQLENGNRQKHQRFNMLCHGKKHTVTSGFSDHFSRNRRCHSPRLVKCCKVLATFLNMVNVYLLDNVYMLYTTYTTYQFNTSS